MVSPVEADEYEAVLIARGAYNFYSDDASVGVTSFVEHNDAIVGSTGYSEDGFEQQIFSPTTTGIELKEVPPSRTVILMLPGRQPRR